MPLEYCEFDPRVERCKEWMKEAHPVAFNRLFVEGVAEGAGDAASASAAASAKPVKAGANGAARGVAARRLTTLCLCCPPCPLDAARIKETGKRKYKTDEVLIKTVQRNKRKYVTHVEGLEAYSPCSAACAAPAAAQWPVPTRPARQRTT